MVGSFRNIQNLGLQPSLRECAIHSTTCFSCLCNFNAKASEGTTLQLGSTNNCPFVCIQEFQTGRLGLEFFHYS